MLISCRDPSFIFIGHDKCLRSSIDQHNSGYTLRARTPTCHRPYAVFTYICGFNGDYNLRSHVAQLWQNKVDELKANDINCNIQFARSASSITDLIDIRQFNGIDIQLRVVYLFKESTDNVAM